MEINKANTKYIGGRYLTQDEWIAMAKKVHGDTYNYNKVKYVDHETKVIIICKEHGEFLQTPSAHSNGKQGCPICGRLKSDAGRRKSLDNVLDRFRTVHGDRYDYSKVVLGNRLKEKVIIICPEHGEFLQSPHKHICNRGCPKCAGKYQLTKEEWFKKAKEIYDDKYDYSKTVYPPPLEAKGMVTITCKEHGDFTKRARDHAGYSFTGNSITQGGCQICASSLGEKRIHSVLKKYNIKSIKEYTFPNTRYRYDFYLPELNILIEYDGAQHFIPVDICGGIDGYIQTVERDNNKNTLAEASNIPLIRIPYTKDNVIEKYLIYRLSQIYKYKVKERYYKTFLDLVKGEQLPSNTKPKDVEQYKLYKK